MPKHLSIVGCGGFGPANADVLTIVKAAAKALATVVTAAIFDFIRAVLSNKAFGKQGANRRLHSKTDVSRNTCCRRLQDGAHVTIV
jgi:hypothetical protein